MELDIVDIFSIGASISTMLGVLVAVVTLGYLYIEKKEKLEADVKQNFLDGKIWRGMDSEMNSINLIIGNNPSYRFSGHIQNLGSSQDGYLFFYFNSLNGKKMTLDICELVSGLEDNVGKATLIYISRDSFWLILDGFYSTSLPSRIYLHSHEI